MEEYLLGEMGGWDEGIGINVVCIYVYEWKGGGGGGFFARIWLCLTNPPRIRERIIDREVG